MLIAIEGVDGAGKSTLADAIAARLPDAKQTHLSKPKSPLTAIDESIDVLEDYRPGGTIDIVADRLHWGCPAYGPIYRPEHDVDGYGEIGKAGFRYLELYMASRGAFTVLAGVTEKDAIKRLKARGDDYVELKDVGSIIERYHEVYAESLTQGTLVFTEVDDPTLSVLPRVIIDAALARENLATPLNRWQSYIGPVNPRVLVLMPPDRDTRLNFLGRLPDGIWHRVGIASSSMPSEELVKLSDALHHPETRILTSTRPGPSYAHHADAAPHRFDTMDELVESVQAVAWPS
jgi:hypothetical protein